MNYPNPFSGTGSLTGLGGTGAMQPMSGQQMTPLSGGQTALGQGGFGQGGFGQQMQGQAQALNYPTQQGQFLGQVAQPMGGQQYENPMVGGQVYMGGQQMPMPGQQMQGQLGQLAGGFSGLFGNPAGMGSNQAGGQQMPMRGNQAFGFANPFGPGYQGQTSQSMLSGFGAGGFGQQMPMRGNQAFGFANPFGPGYQGQTSQSMLGGFGAGGQGQAGALNGSFNGTQASGGFNGSQLGNMVQQNYPYQSQNFLQPPQLPGYAAPQATQPFNLGLGSLNGI